MPERLADMDVNNIERSLCFPTFPRFCGQTFLEAHDKELASACVVAYNDWMVEEWAGESGGRLLPLGMVPLWDGQLAAAEVVLKPDDDPMCMQMTVPVSSQAAKTGSQ